MIGAPIDDAGIDDDPMTRTAAGLDIPMFDAFLDSLWAPRATHVRRCRFTTGIAQQPGWPAPLGCREPGPVIVQRSMPTGTDGPASPCHVATAELAIPPSPS